MPAWFHADDGWWARLILQRGLGVIYFVAFVVALTQFRPLLGEHGLLPVPRFVARVPFKVAPSLFHFRYSDRLLVAAAGLGAVLALAVVLGLPDSWPVGLTMAVWLTLWVLYLSIVNVGQRFYGFGWESLLLEAGFLAAFLGPAWSAPPAFVLFGFRWLLFRLELGAGLIKMRGDPCWRKGTCLYYHHETQPMPNPFSWFFHRLPKRLHRIEVWGSHFAQLVCPFLLFLPQPVATVGALVMAVTQSWLVLSGNFSWLNLTTIVLCASALSGSLLGLPAHATAVVSWHDGVVTVVTLGIALLSIRPALNLLSRHQMMNASFDPIHLVNTYGAFGSISKVRREIVLEGADSLSPDAVWKEYECKGKPSDPKKRPRQYAPYHLRLDWMMWFAGLGLTRELGWLLPLLRKLLENDEPTLRLLAKNPFPEKPPAAVRVVMYQYRFTTWQERRETGAWWHRKRLGVAIPPLTLEDIPILA
jgi:hypothetical protein